MSYILKNNSGLVTVRLTDAGRKKLSQGNLSLSLFQLGDSEFCYDSNTDVLQLDSGISVTEPKCNAQNISNVAAERNKQNVKYPIPVLSNNSGSTYGVLSPAHSEQPVYNTARPRGFFSGSSSNFSQNGLAGMGFSAFTSAGYVLSANWCFPLSAMTGGSVMYLWSGNTQCSNQDYWAQPGDLVMVQYVNPFTPNHLYPGCDGTQGGTGGLLNMPTNFSTPYLFYNVISGATSAATHTKITQQYITVDRNLPDWTYYNFPHFGPGLVPSAQTTCARVLIIPGGGVTSYWGADTPIPYWSPGSLSFDNNCDVSVKDVNIWNMNINWTQWDGNNINAGTVAGVNKNVYENVDGYGSTGYCSTKEYLGYNSDDGQFDTTNAQDYYGANNVEGYEPETSGTFIRDSFGKIRTILPSDQRCVAVLHYTNYTISNFYGEKFALEPNGTVLNGIGEMDNFKIHLPYIMWHKKKGSGTGLGDECQIGQTFYVDPPGFSVAEEHYIESTPNQDMNTPGIRYYHLWDNNLAATNSTGQGVPNRVGKVFPDLQMITIDDQELIAALSYKSNRNWTLPMPKLELIPAGTNCSGTVSQVGLFNSTPNTEELYVSYLMGSVTGYTTGMHCNYYSKIIGDTSAGSRDVTLAFGPEWPYLRGYNAANCTYSGTGWQADSFNVIFQKVPYGTYPDPANWKIYDITSQVSNHTPSNPIFGTNMANSNCSFYINNDIYTGATGYTFHNYINVPLNNDQEPWLLQFGDEEFFFGNLETDIMATIYEMKYNVTVSNNQFNTSLNPTWANANTVRITEIGLFDAQKDLMAIAKLRSPVKRQGTQTFVVKIDY